MIGGGAYLRGHLLQAELGQPVVQAVLQERAPELLLLHLLLQGLLLLRPQTGSDVRVRFGVIAFRRANIVWVSFRLYLTVEGLSPSSFVLSSNDEPLRL